jgi:hypothetical protein
MGAEGESVVNGKNGLNPFSRGEKVDMISSGDITCLRMG